MSYLAALIGRPCWRQEWADYTSDCLPWLQEDRELDADSRYPGSHHFEKMTAGLYMGNLARLIILRHAWICYRLCNFFQCLSQIQCDFVMSLILERSLQVGTGGQPLWRLRAADAAGGVHSVDSTGTAARLFSLLQMRPTLAAHPVA